MTKLTKEAEEYKTLKSKGQYLSGNDLIRLRELERIILHGYQ